MVLPALPFSIAAACNPDLNPIPTLVWFDRLEWWLLVGPALFGIVWPLAIAIVAARRNWFPACSTGTLPFLALLAIAFSVTLFCLCSGAL